MNNTLLGFISSSSDTLVQKPRKIYKRNGVTHVCYKRKFYAPVVESETKVNRTLKMSSVTPIEESIVKVFQAPDIEETWFARKF